MVRSPSLSNLSETSKSARKPRGEGGGGASSPNGEEPLIARSHKCYEFDFNTLPTFWSDYGRIESWRT